MKEAATMFNQIKEMSKKRLEYEGRLKDPRLLQPSDIYYQKPLEYALAIYSYYMCFKVYFWLYSLVQKALFRRTQKLRPRR